MDIGLFIIVMIVMYVVPEILKRLKTKKPYKYPEFPQPLPQGGQGPVSMPGGISRGMKPPPVMEMTGEGMPGDEGDPSWGVHSQPALPEIIGLAARPEDNIRIGTGDAAMGFIWAEIIAPPVALRQTRRSMRKC